MQYFRYNYTKKTYLFVVCRKLTFIQADLYFVRLPKFQGTWHLPHELCHTIPRVTLCAVLWGVIYIGLYVPAIVSTSVTHVCAYQRGSEPRQGEAVIF